MQKLVIILASIMLAQCGYPAEIQMPNKPYHHLTKGFRNPPNSIARSSTSGQRLRFFWGMVTRSFARPAMPERFMTSAETAKAQLAQAGEQSSISWLGHSTFLLALKNANVLTDPVFSKRASPVPFAGPKRLHKMPLTIKDLPPLDVIIISHAHYDHLDMGALKRLPNKERILAVVPLGLGRYMTRAGFTQVREIDWFESFTHKGLVITGYPAVHWSNRSPWDLNRTLWMSYAISDGTHRFYHTGDTEWHDTIFGDIGADMQTRYGGCDVALLSVGAYEPRPIMTGAHATPDDMVRIGKAIGCQLMVPMHWGTFVLSEESVTAPYERFNKAAGNQALNFRIGETQLLEKLGLQKILPKTPE